MLYIFVINGRKDKACIKDEIVSQLSGLDINHEIYTTAGPGDATRYVRMYSKFHDTEEVCFVSCGGTGLANEIASGLVGAANKYMAVMSYGVTNDFLKYYPGRDFGSVKALIDGEKVSIDAIKCNDDYAINVINIGFDALVAYEGEIINEGTDKNGYTRGLLKSILSHRYHNLTVYADGEKISKGFTLLCNASNGRYCGDKFLCGPKAINDDGLIDFCHLRSMTLVEMLAMVPSYMKGTHIDSKFWRYKVTYRRCKHIEISSKDLIIVCLDGEIIESSHLTIDIMEKAINLILPKA